MKRRTAVALCLASAIGGAFAMLIFLNAQHQYGWKAASQVAQRSAEFRPIRTGDPPPPPDEQQLALARPVCETLSRSSGLPVRQLSDASNLIQRVPLRRIDTIELERSFGDMDRLRMTALGLSKQDRALASASVQGDFASEQVQNRFFESLTNTLRACHYLRSGGGQSRELEVVAPE